MRKITLILASLLALGAVSCTGGKQDEKPVAKRSASSFTASGT